MEEKVKLALQWMGKEFKAIKLQIGYGTDEDVGIMSALKNPGRKI